MKSQLLNLLHVLGVCAGTGPVAVGEALRTGAALPRESGLRVPTLLPPKNSSFQPSS